MKKREPGAEIRARLSFVLLELIHNLIIIQQAHFI